jgi:hypothetical protein
VIAGALALSLLLTPVGVHQTAWSSSQSRHFEVHYSPGLAADRDRVIRAAEQAYRQVSNRLNFVLPTKVPLVLFAPSGPLTREEIVAYATSDAVAPQQPHRSRIVVPLSERGPELDAFIVHELTHLLMYEIVLPGRGGDGGLPRWVREGIATYMAGPVSDEDARAMRELVVSGNLPALSELTGSDGFTDARLNDVVGHVAFDFIDSRWGPAALRRFVNALIVPRVARTYDAVFELTPAEFDAAFRQYAQRRFGPAVR